MSDSNEKILPTRIQASGVTGVMVRAHTEKWMDLGHSLSFNPSSAINVGTSGAVRISDSGRRFERVSIIF